MVASFLPSMRYVLLVMELSFVKRAKEWIDWLYSGMDHANKIDDFTEESFKTMMWGILKLQWSRDPEIDELGLLEHLPEELQDPTLKIVVKDSKQEFKLDNGEGIPMFMYANKMTAASDIPQILLCVAKQGVVAHDGKGHAHNTTKSIIKNIGDIGKN